MGVPEEFSASGGQPLIIIDSREKRPLFFAGADTTVRKLDAGDYSLEGHEDKIAFERKAGPTELSNNIIKDHFWAAMKRLSEVERPHFIIECTEADIAIFPKGKKGLPRRLWKRSRIKPAFIFSSLKRIEDMGIKVIYAGDSINAAVTIEQIFTEYMSQK